MGKLTGSSRRSAVVALVGAAGLVLGVVSPAAAQTEPTVGAGAGTGWEYAEPVFECGLPTSGVAYDSTEFVLTYLAATYDSVDALGVEIASYLGEVEMTITLGENTAAPQGAAPGQCPGGPLLLVPAPIPIESVVIDGTAGTGTVHCDNVHDLALFTRASSAVAFTFTVDCDITGNVIGGSVENVPVRHVIEGTMNPCFVPNPLFILFGLGPEFVANPECPLDTLNPDPFAGGPNAASSHLVTAFEAVGPSPV